jgi:hypothetical protein
LVSSGWSNVSFAPQADIRQRMEHVFFVRDMASADVVARANQGYGAFQRRNLVLDF